MTTEAEESREATYAERATWGTCPACGAKHGEKCDADKGWPFGMTISGKPAPDGVHLGRLQNAPKMVALVKVS